MEKPKKPPEIKKVKLNKEIESLLLWLVRMLGGCSVVIGGHSIVIHGHLWSLGANGVFCASKSQPLKPKPLHISCGFDL